jgi:DHA2 family multidrug resistance protein
MYILGLSIFTVSSYLCAISWNLHALVAFRIIQGIGGGILTPVGMSLFTAEFPPHKRGVAIGFYSIAIAAAISLGPSVGGYLIQKISWKWIFLINLPFGLLTLLAAWAILKRSRGKPIHDFDLWGLITLTLFVVFLLVAISSGNAPWNAEGWTSFFTLASFAISGVSGVAFFIIERRIDHPIVDLSVFHDRNFLLGNIVLFIFSFTLFGSSFLLPLYLQNGLDYSKIRTGLVLLPIGLIQGFVGATTGWLIKKVPAWFLVIGGIIALGLSYHFNAKFSLYTEESTMLWVFAFRGLSMALMFAPLVTLTIGTIPEEKLAQATGLFSLQRQIGAALGVAVFETIFTERQVHHTEAFGQTLQQGLASFDQARESFGAFIAAHFGSTPEAALLQAQQLIFDHIGKEIFIQSIADNLLVAGWITFLSAIPLLFLRKDKVRSFLEIE